MKKQYLYAIICSAFALMSCGKEFLDIKRQAHQVVPVYIRDYANLLNHYTITNARNATELAFIGSDEYTVSDVRFNALSQAYQRNAYIWKEDVFEGGESMDWNWGYERILYANLALDVEKIEPKADELAQWNYVRGAARFLRSLTFFQLSLLFAPEYQSESAATTDGIPLRLDYDVQVRVGISRLEEVYQRIIEDLETAAELLPDKVDNVYQPSKQAVYALLARVYLQKGEYAQSDKYAERALSIDDTLIDFRKLDKGLTQSFTSYGRDVAEVIYYQFNTSTIINASRLNIHPQLLDKYESNDLRKAIYFRTESDGRVVFKGSYSGGSQGYFSGLAIDELYLIRAECLTRMNHLEQALYWLNILLENRYDNSFVPLVIDNREMLLARVLEEREKELCLRSIRWNDMRRLNKEKEFARTYYRQVNGTTYQLTPDSPRWVWPIPDNEKDHL